MITLDKIIGLIAKENGFFITLATSYSSREYTSADDFYESDESKEMLKKEVLFINTRENKVNVFINW